jgi:hypothetical protein
LGVRAWGLALVAAGVAQGAWGQAPRRFPSPPPEIARLALPTGELAPVVAYPTVATYLETASVVRRGDVVDLRTLEVYEPGASAVRGPVVEMVVSRTVDCARRTMTEHGGLAYDAAGVAVVWVSAYAEEPIAQMVCDGSTSPRPAVQGHAAARATARAEMIAYREAQERRRAGR